MCHSEKALRDLEHELTSDPIGEGEVRVCCVLSSSLCAPSAIDSPFAWLLTTVVPLCVVALLHPKVGELEEDVAQLQREIAELSAKREALQKWVYR